MSAEEVPMGTGPMSGSMLRWYPAGWRARYGDEFAAMVEDDLGGRSPTLGYRWSIARSGLKERLCGAGLVGDSAPPPERVRGGAFTVLCAFALFILPGAGFAKISEHWDQSISRGPRHVPTVSFNLLASLAGGCAVAVMLGAATVLPTFLRFLRDSGWSAIRRRVVWAVVATVATTATTAALAIWARHLTYHQRNSGFGWYQLLFTVFVILFASTIATWSAAAVSATRRLHLGAGQIKAAGSLAVAVALAMPVMTAAAAVWWASMATTAPWFLAGTAPGSSPSPVATNLLVVLIVMTIASVVGLVGLLRVVHSWPQLRSA
jgi:hypothetical protein